jgi:hypothetical protein
VRVYDESWNVYQLQELDPDLHKRFTNVNTGELTTDKKWELVSTHDTEEEALEAASKL